MSVELCGHCGRPEEVIWVLRASGADYRRVSCPNCVPHADDEPSPENAQDPLVL
ncbi:hypothetical protein [Streptomyces luteireticuli]|uniref:hypothetical protein n=1 Tax=Streptomyces luteireticuli TaxID=173858 RepID=UPI00355794A4